MNWTDQRGLPLSRLTSNLSVRCCSRQSLSNRIAILHIRNTSLHKGQEAVRPRLHHNPCTFRGVTPGLRFKSDPRASATRHHLGALRAASAVEPPVRGAWRGFLYEGLGVFA